MPGFPLLEFPHDAACALRQLLRTCPQTGAAEAACKDFFSAQGGMACHAGSV
jgi:hypothetical protein